MSVTIYNCRKHGHKFEVSSDGTCLYCIYCGQGLNKPVIWETGAEKDFPNPREQRIGKIDPCRKECEE